MELHCFTVNPFYQNTYLFWEDPDRAVIVDPGFYTSTERVDFQNFLSSHGLKLSEVILTHAHIDHIFGLEFVFKEFGLKPRMNRNEMMTYSMAVQVSQMYGLEVFKYPEVGDWIDEGSKQNFGGVEFDVYFTPGHSPGSLSFHSSKNQLLLSGDVLFEGSIGRTDLPGGDHGTLIRSIKEKLLPLPHQTKVYSGHGGITTIGQEKLTNPFL